MTSQPDKLFRDKLENFTKPAPDAAWNRIEADLDKTRTKGLWLKIAAGLALLAVAAILLWPETSTDNSGLLSKSNSTQTEIKNNRKDENRITDSESTAATQGKENQNEKVAFSSGRKINKTIKKETAWVAQSTEENNNLESSIGNPASTALPEGVVAQAIQNEETTVEPQQSQTIVYTADEVNAKYLKKKVPPDATSDEKKSSSLQKLMGLAYNLKNTETGLGDLRQKKNEILALNFRDKKDNQN